MHSQKIKPFPFKITLSVLPHAHQILLRSSSTELNLAHPRFEGRINVDRSVVMKQNDLPVGLLCPCKLAPLPLGTHRVL